MSRSSPIWAFFQRWFLVFAMALGAVSCGGRSDEGLLPPEGDSGLDGSYSDAPGSRGDAGDASADGRFGDGSGGTLDPDGRGPDGGPGAALIRIEVDPPVATLAVPTTRALTVTGIYANGRTETLLQGLSFESSPANIATVSAMGVVTAASPGTATITVTKFPEGLTATSTITVSPARVTSLAITPMMATTGIGGTVSFKATGTLSDGTTQDVTDTVNWTSNPASVASISNTVSMTMPKGVATGAGAGMATITAAMPTGGLTATATLTVTDARLVSIAITPANQILPVGVDFRFTATGTYSDGKTADITATVQWSSSLSGVAPIGATTGTGTTAAPGTTEITASLAQGGMTITGTTRLTVTPATLVSITIEPAMSTVIVGLTQQLRATGRYSNMTNTDLTESVTWTSSNPTAASVSVAAGNEGLVSGLAPGMATITASLSGVSGTATVTVVDARLTAIAITPNPASVPKGATVPLTANGTFDNGIMADVTTRVTWTIENTALATISNAAGSNGQVTGITEGATTVRAASGMVTASAPLNVTAAVPQSIEVTPPDSMLQVTRTQRMTANAVYTDGSRVDITTQAVWSTGRAATASISNGAGSQGTVTAVAVGTTTITATWQGLMGTTNITVTPAIPTSITVTPFTATIAVGGTQPYTAVVIYDIGTQATVTGQCMWTSSDVSVATIGQGGGGGGGGGGGAATARGIGGGMVTITCSYTAVGVTLTGTAMLTVNFPTRPVSLTVTPNPTSVTVNGTVSLAATVTYDNMTTATVTNTSSWVTSDATIAGVVTSGNMRGVVTGLRTGMVTITASFVASGVTVTGTAMVAVEGTPTGLTMSPGAHSMLVGATTNYTLSLLYSDGSSTTVPANSTLTVCSSSDAAIATIQTMGNNRQGRCLGEGTATLTCTYTPMGGTPISGTSTLECIAAAPIRIDISPGASTVPLGSVVSYTATATFADGTMQNITTNAATTWISSNVAVASINNSGQQKGEASTLSQGSTTISCEFRGVSAMVTLSVGPVAPVGLSITPSGGTLPVGSMTPYTALLRMSNGTTTDVTQMATWTSSAPGGDAGPAVATVTNTGTRGVVTAVGPGTAQIRASHTVGGGTFMDSVNVSVQ